MEEGKIGMTIGENDKKKKIAGMWAHTALKYMQLKRMLQKQ